MTRHPVFISWSGETSKAIAEAVTDFLSDLFPQVKTFISGRDIPKGTRWSAEITSKLAEVRFGVVCLTPDNVAEPWLLFESGAISKLPDARLFTLLHGLEYVQVPYPLAMFNHAKTDERDVVKLVESLNSSLEDDGLEVKRLHKAFERLWPNLDAEISRTTSKIKKDASPKDFGRENHKLLTELVTTVRDVVRANRSEGLGFGHPEDMEELRSAVLDYLKPLLDEIGIKWNGIATHNDGETISIICKMPTERVFRTSFRSVMELVFGYKSKRTFVLEAGLKGEGIKGLPRKI